MEAQGHPLEKSMLFQENESIEKMEKNGRDLTTRRSRNINIRHFFVNDRVYEGEFTAEYCPTKLMISEFITKLLQGKQSEIFRSLIIRKCK